MCCAKIASLESDVSRKKKLFLIAVMTEVMYISYVCGGCCYTVYKLITKYSQKFADFPGPRIT